ncbi:uncharacterized protein [Mytilus edulis]|uniref:uncharacterized protein n=1 Tax=Mytilus edulis TaxID=6550 RepID=UPI0039F10E00
MACSQSAQEGQIPVSCELCETNRPIKWKCLDCDLLLCNHCKEKVHLKVKTAKDHRIIDLKEIGLYKEELDFANIPCQEHAGQNTCLYCKTCDALVCPTCVSKVHKKHDLTEIQEGYNIKIDKLRKGQSKIQRNRKDIVSIQERLNQLLSSENSKYNQVHQNILKHEKNVKKEVEMYFKKLRDELDERYNNVSDSIKSDLNAVSILLKQADTKTNEVQESIKITNTSKFFTEFSNLEKYIDIQLPLARSSTLSSPNFVPGQITQFNIGVLELDENPSDEPYRNLEINKVYQTELDVVSQVCFSIDQSFWMTSVKLGLVQKVKPEGTKLKILSSYKAEVYSMAVTQSNNLLISTGESRLKQISDQTGSITDSVYNVSPFLPAAVHITNDNKVLVGCICLNDGPPKHVTMVVVLMNQNGDHERVYEHDQHKNPMLTYPTSITSTRNGNIHVVDRESKGVHKVVVLGQGTDIINIYTGHAEINQDFHGIKIKPFIPGDIVTTPRDNVILADINTHTLHILNNAGLLMTYYKTTDMNIISPWSLAFSLSGQLYIGCGISEDNENEYAKIYEMTISRC